MTFTPIDIARCLAPFVSIDFSDRSSRPARGNSGNHSLSLEVSLALPSAVTDIAERVQSWREELPWS